MIPNSFTRWFKQQGWTILPHQRAMVEQYVRGESTLLIAPTGTGKTLSGFLPSLIELAQTNHQGLHTLYISPLKALTQDIERNLMKPMREMELNATVESRTGDTSAHRRKRQRLKPPNLLLTTPESLMLLLSYPEAPQMFAQVKSIIVDEIHSFAPGKRGDLVALALAQLSVYAPNHLRFGLSATVADPAILAAWLGPVSKPVSIVKAKPGKKPHVTLLKTTLPIPYTGFMGKYAVPEIMREIEKARTAIVFVNTRAQAELLFQMLWEVNEKALPIGLYHSSLTREKRLKTTSLMADGKLRAIVATSALELGVDWGDVDVVIQVGPPKGVSRLLQRVGRSNHKVDQPSKALLVPANRFELLECRAAIDAIAGEQLDGELPDKGTEDVVIQFIMNAACSAPVSAEMLYGIVQRCWPYRHLTRVQFEKLFAFVVNGGYALRAYERFQRLVQNDHGLYEPASRAVVQRHRQNIGVIVEAGKLKVKRIGKRGRGSIIGEVEEHFAMGMEAGDTFYFAGEVLEYITIREMFLEARPSPGKEPLIPTYAGGQMPLSTFLADGVRHLLEDPGEWGVFAKDMRDWLTLQERFSVMPGRNRFLIETFPCGQLHYSVYYTFEGRRANQTLGMLITRRMERQGLLPLTFTVTDYGLAIASVEPVTQKDAQYLLAPEILFDEMEEWLAESRMLKRSFRRVATIAGLVEQNSPGAKKTMKQVTFSTDLIYDVLRKHEPEHVLLSVTRTDAERELLDTERLSAMLAKYQEKITFMELPRASPLSIPIILDVRTERLPGRGVEALLAQLAMQGVAEEMMQDVCHAIAGEKQHAIG